MEDEASPVSRSEAVSSSHDVEKVESHGDGEEMEDFLDSKFSCRTCMKDSVVVSNFNFEIDKEHLLITSTSISNFLAS